MEILNSPNSFISFRKKQTPRSLYIHGEVGRGKTFIMDLFFDSLKTKQKIRLHFHRFMNNLHSELHELVGQKDPIKKIVKQLSKKYKVLCFDEFFVEDIGDAMLLGRFMTELFSSGICLITTSNIEPKNLYANGLQRKLFIPAIKSIEKNCEIFFLNSDSDYRLRTLEQTKLVFIPLGNESELNMLDTFMALSKSKKINDSSIKVLDRKINIIKSSEGTIWFNFKDICSSPRSSADYIEIAKEFHNVLISNIPIINSDDEARRFISLIDECYDRKVKIITSAAIEFPKIYTGNKLIEKYKRTVSRLIEMQSKEYLKEAHKP